MGRLLFLIALGTLGLGVCAPSGKAQDSPSNPNRELAERVIGLGGQVEILLPDKKIQRVRKVSDLPEGDFGLTRIDFAGQSRVTDADLANLDKLPDLMELNLSYTRITDQGLAAVEKLISLRQLSVAETPITDAALVGIAALQNLVSLDLSGTNITDGPLKELARLPELSRLFLGRTRVTAAGIKVLAGLPQLTVLHLAGLKLEAAELAEICQMPRLEEVSLSTTNQGLEKLAEMPKLKILTVHGPAISDEGMPALAKLTRLEQLRLSQTGISERGLRLLKDSLKTCRIVAHPVSRQSAFLMASGPSQRPVIPWQPSDDKNTWNGLVSRPAKLPGIARWQLETREPRSEIRSVDFSPNGQQIACATAAGHVRIYDANTLALRTLIPGHASGAHALAYSPDGGRLASAGSDGMLRIWNPQGQQLLELKGHRGAVTSVAWSPDGQWLASGGWDSSVRLWKADGSSSRELKGHAKGVMAVTWSPEGTQFATGGGDATIRIWDLNGKELHVLTGHTSNVCSLAWNSRGSRLASGSWDKTIRFWNPKTGRGGPVLEGHTYRVNALEWHPEGSMLASGGDQTLRLWTLDGTPARTVKTEVDHILTLSWKHDGKEIVTGSRFSSILRVVDLNNASERVTGESTQAGVNAMAWHPSGDRIAVGCRDHKIRLITEDGRAGAILSGPIVRTVEWSPNGERLASGGDALLRLWNRQVIPLSASKEHAKNIVCLAWSPDGKFLATVSEDSTARVWSADGKVEQVINLNAPPRRVVWSPDSQQFATASDKQVQIWNREGTPGPELSEPPANLVALAWNKHTGQIAAGGWSRDFQLWDGEGVKGSTQKQVQAIMDIAIPPQGDQVAMALFDNKAVVTKADGSQGRVWEAHAGAVNSVAWHPQGRVLVTGGYDNTLRFWDANTLRPERTVLFLGDGASASLTAAGQIEHGDLPVLEDELVYLVETEAGDRKLLSPAEFETQFHESGTADR